MPEMLIQGAWDKNIEVQWGSPLRWIFLSLFILLSGCMPSEIVSETERYLGDAALIDNQQGTGGPNYILHPSSHFFLASALPGSGYPELDDWLVVQTAHALRRYFPRVEQSPERLSMAGAMAQGRALGADYLILPEPLFAEDQYGHPDDWEDIPMDIYATGRDTVELRFRLYSLADGRLVGIWRYRSRSGLLTFVNDIPEDLTEPAVEDFARRLTAYPK